MNLIYSFDIRVADFFFSLREPWLVGFFSAITILGEWQVIILFVFITLLVLWFLKKRVYIIPLLLSVVGSEAMTYLIKAILRRPRPELAFYLEDSFSFPSGHATIAVAFYGFLLFMFLRFVKTQKSKIFFPQNRTALSGKNPFFYFRIFLGKYFFIYFCDIHINIKYPT